MSGLPDVLETLRWVDPRTAPPEPQEQLLLAVQTKSERLTWGEGWWDDIAGAYRWAESGGIVAEPVLRYAAVRGPDPARCETNR